VDEGFDAATLRDWVIPDAEQRYTDRDTILYALGVGAGQQGPEADLSSLYEPQLQALPTMAAVLANSPTWLGEAGTGVDMTRVLHGEQRLIVHRPLASHATVRSRSRILELHDKGPGKDVLITLERRLFDVLTGAHLVTNQSTVLLRGYGSAAGGGSSSDAALPALLPAPAHDCNIAIDVPTRVEQAALYRLSGDSNPLHIDPAAARQAGFARPLLHGLCTFGIACRVLLRELSDKRSVRLLQLAGRFAGPVWPGEGLRIEIWRQPLQEGDGARSQRVAFQVRVPARDALALSHGHALLQA
jgi:acyl dehydratase